ncbi:hypothetical protein [Owenweeksia hongkongensis]|uniref:hypothetical protein n=1 Tax=Owenweeksia hongkongensis TaxID=253245 RepID=UPI003A8F5A54
MTEIILENSLLWLIPIAGVAALATWLLYFRGKMFTPNQRKILSVFRFLTLFFLGFLLLSPLLKSTKTREEKPILVWLEDHSSSMLSANDSAAVIENLNNFKISSSLSNKYDIQYFDFSDKLTEPSDSFNGLSTDLYEALQEASEKYYNQNVGAVVLHSDGIGNRGGNPSYVASGLAYPIYTVGYGDTTLQKDLFIERVISNKVSYLNNKMPVELYLRARQLQGLQYELTVKSANGSTVFSKKLSIGSQDYFERVNFFIKAEKAGVQRYTVSVGPVSGEVNLTNNISVFSVEVLDNKKKISIIGYGPHPDIGALNQSLKTLERYEVKTVIQKDWDGAIGDADLYILHDPSSLILDKFSESKKPVWIIYGSNTSADAFAKLTGLRTESGSFEEVYPVAGSGFNLFNTDDQYQLQLDEMPPLNSPFGEIFSKKPIYSLFTKKIGRVATNSPLWFFTQEENQRQAVILGTGIWRWRIYDFKETENHEAFDRLISKTVQYLTTDARRQRFVVDMPDRVEQGEQLRAEARLYNRSLELINEPDLKITFTAENASEYEFSFAKDQNTYSLNAGRLPEGLYNYKSTVTLGDETFSRQGSVLIEKSYLEQADGVARHHVLRKISTESGGKFYNASQMEALTENLMANTKATTYTYEETSTDSLINEKWLFALFVLFLTIEWALRKYFGNY